MNEWSADSDISDPDRSDSPLLNTSSSSMKHGSRSSSSSHAANTKAVPTVLRTSDRVIREWMERADREDNIADDDDDDSDSDFVDDDAVRDAGVTAAYTGEVTAAHLLSSHLITAARLLSSHLITAAHLSSYRLITAAIYFHLIL